MVPDIEIQHLSVCFDTAQGPVYAVNDLSTTFRAGRISGVIGESGSGKSVMGMSLLRLLPNTARVTGKCFFGEDELYSMPLRRLRRLRGAAIGLIPQNPGASLDPVMKLRRQLTEAITTHGRWKRREAEAQAAELLRRFGFEEPERILNQYSFQMSGGMNQRLVSALGLACRPGWVIADEPTKGLDAVIRNQVYSVLRRAPLQHARHHPRSGPGPPAVRRHPGALHGPDHRAGHGGGGHGAAPPPLYRRPDPFPAQPGHGAHTTPGPRTAGAHRLPLLPPLPQGHGALRPGGAGGGRAAHGREGEVLPL